MSVEQKFFVHPKCHQVYMYEDDDRPHYCSFCQEKARDFSYKPEFQLIPIE